MGLDLFIIAFELAQAKAPKPGFFLGCDVFSKKSTITLEIQLSIHLLRNSIEYQSRYVNQNLRNSNCVLFAYCGLHKNNFLY